jgi:hypothetical protein
MTMRAALAGATKNGGGSDMDVVLSFATIMAWVCVVTLTLAILLPPRAELTPRGWIALVVSVCWLFAYYNR